MRSNTEIFPKYMGATVGTVTALFGTSMGSQSMKFLTMPWAIQSPVLLGVIVGAVLLRVPTNFLEKRIDETFPLNSHAMQNRSYHFLLQAASMTLGTLVGLAVTTAFTSIIANPFTLPALIAAGISALIMFGVYVKTKPTAAPQTAPHQSSSANNREVFDENEDRIFSQNRL